MSAVSFPAAACLAVALLALACPAHAQLPEAPVVLMDIQVESQDELPVEEIRRLWPWEPGLEISREALAGRMDLVRKLPFIDALEWHLTEVEGGQMLVLAIERRDIIREVEISGLGQLWRPIFEITAINALRLRGGDAFDEAKLAEDTERLQELFRGMGFFSVHCEPKLDREPGTVAIHHDCERGPSFRIAAIEVVGASAFSPEEVADSIRPWPYYRKDDLQENIDELLEDYRELGYVTARLAVTDLEVRSENAEVDLVVKVDEGRQLVVSFENNEALDDDDLEEVLPFRPERSDGTFLVGDGTEAIRLAYEKAGHPDTSVESSREIEGDEVLVHYAITEGPAFELEGLRIEGIEAEERPELNEQHIAKVLAADSNRFLFFAPVWDSGKLEADRAAIRSLYRSRGYAEVVVSEPRREQGEEGLVAVFEVTEGSHFEIGRVQAIGVPDELTAAVENIREQADRAEHYRVGDVTRASRQIASLLHDTGYLNAVVETQESREASRVDLIFRAMPGPRFMTGPIFLLGNNHTSDAVIRDALEIETGEVLLPDDMGETSKQVRSLDVFESIRLLPIGLNDATGSGEHAIFRAPIALVFRERPRMELSAGVLYDTDRGFGTTASIQHNNLFGRALRLSLSGEVGQRDLAARLTLADPRLFGTSIRGTTFVSYEDRELEAFDEEEFLVGGRIARDLSDEWTVAFDLSYRLTDITNVKDAEDPDTPEAGFSRALLWTPAVSYDSRDNPLSPSSGIFSSGNVTLSSTAAASDDDYVRIDFQYRNYWSLFGDSVAVLAASFTDVELYGDTTTVPTSELLFAGGGTTVRGFEEDRIGALTEDGTPLGGGTRVILNAELRFPLYLPLEAAVFIDSGSVTRDISELDLDSLQTAVGAGLRLRSPVGPVRIDFGYPLEKNPLLDDWRIHFSFGYPF